MKLLTLALFTFITGNAFSQDMNGTFGLDCVDTFQGRQCKKIVEIKYDVGTYRIKTFGLGDERRVEEFGGTNPDHEIYWIVEGKHLMLNRKFDLQQQQQQQGSGSQSLCYQGQCQQNQHGQDQHRISCQKIIHIQLTESESEVWLNQTTYCNHRPKVVGEQNLVLEKL